MVLDDKPAEEWPVSFYRSGFGNFSWFQKFYHLFKAPGAAYRKPLAGVCTKEDGDTLISPKTDKESRKEGVRKFVKDNRTAEVMLMYLQRVKGVYGENFKRYAQVTPSPNDSGMHGHAHISHGPQCAGRVGRVRSRGCRGGEAGQNGQAAGVMPAA